MRNPKPHLRMKRFTFPKKASIDSIVMRELDGEDDIEASVWADKHATELIKTSYRAAMAAEQREAIRVSIVAVNDQPTEPGVPFMEMDLWTSATQRMLMECYVHLNGAEETDLKNLIAGAEELSEVPSISDEGGGAPEGP